jgi:hypothetical protein
MKVALLVGLLMPLSAVAQVNRGDADAIINRYYICVGNATGRDAARFSNPEAAVERAFFACQTEEVAIRAYAELNNIEPAQINAIIATHRARAKAFIVEKLTRPTPTKRQ